MTVEQFRAFQLTRPFEPFAIHIADSRSIPVRHPEIVCLSRSGRTIHVQNEEGQIEVIDLLLITSLRRMSDVERRARMLLRR